MRASNGPVPVPDPPGRRRNIGVLLAVLVVVSIGLYANTLSHQWAFDDPLVYTEHPAVQEGASGIPRLVTSDAYSHLYERMGREQELSGGRYRPLSLVTFALEVEAFGTDPRVAHAGNVFLYALTCSLIFLVLLRMGVGGSDHEMPENPGRLGRAPNGTPSVIGRAVPGGGVLAAGGTRWAFLAALVFTVHPIHTEVVANVKGRDELLSLLFVLVALHLTLGRKGKDAPRVRAFTALGVGAATFLALLAKEYGVLLLVLLPIARFVFRGESAVCSLRASIPVAFALAVYVPLRILAVGFQQVEAVDLLNDPYLLASPMQEAATKVYVLLRYVVLLVWPHPLACDYGYREIAYRTFASPEVWAAILAHLVLVVVCVLGVLRRRWFGFAAAFYLGHLVPVSNLFIEIGATMGERLVYHGSLGVAMAFAALCTWPERGHAGPVLRRIGPILAIVVVGAYAVLTVQRNADWYDDTTLFTHDVEVVPGSARVQVNAGRGFLARAAEEGRDEAEATQLVHRAISHLEQGLSIDPDVVAGYLALGVAFDRLGDYERMESAWSEARTRFPDHPLFDVYDPILADRRSRRALAAAQAGNARAAREHLEKAVSYQPEDGRLWFYLGRLLSAQGDSAAALGATRRAAELGVTGDDLR